MIMFYFVYVLQSKKDGNLYIGFTPDLRSRVKKHNDGKVNSASYRYPLELIYYEAHKDRDIAQKRERQLKIGRARTALRKRLIGIRQKV